MSINDPIGDLLTRLRNGQQRGKSSVRAPLSSLRRHVLDVLAAEGYIRGYAEVDADGRAELEIELKYHEGRPVILEITRVSKPGRRIYSSVKELPRVRNGLGIAIVSTPKGVMSDADARAQNVGGEVICQVF